MAKKFIAAAINPAKKGQLHRDLKVPQGKKIPADQLEDAADRPGKIGQRARLAVTLRKLRTGKTKF